MTIDDRYQRLLARRAPLEARVFEKYAESFEGEAGTATKYLLGAMRPIDGRYTARLTEQGDRVENQLERRLRDDYPEIKFRRQGSVSNLTHIRHYSDVDVLVMIDTFFTLEPPQQPANPYRGVPEDDLLQLRSRCARELAAAFPAVEIDDTGATALTLLKSASLACDVDVVSANWFDTLAYAASRQERDRAIQVLDREKHARKRNSPFLFNHRLQEHDNRMKGVPRMLIRLLKTVKADIEEESGTLDISSFDLCSIVYHFHNGTSFDLNAPLELIVGELGWMMAVAENPNLRKGVLTIDDSREIFDRAEKAQAFAKITLELGSICLSAMNNEQQSRRLLTAAHWG